MLFADPVWLILPPPPPRQRISPTPGYPVPPAGFNRPARDWRAFFFSHPCLRSVWLPAPGLPAKFFLRPCGAQVLRRRVLTVTGNPTHSPFTSGQIPPGCLNATHRFNCLFSLFARNSFARVRFAGRSFDKWLQLKFFLRSRERHIAVPPCVFLLDLSPRVLCPFRFGSFYYSRESLLFRDRVVDSPPLRLFPLRRIWSLSTLLVSASVVLRLWLACDSRDSSKRQATAGRRLCLSPLPGGQPSDG